MIFAHSYIFACMPHCASLSNDDISSLHNFSVLLFHTKILWIRISSIFGCSTGFFSCLTLRLDVDWQIFLKNLFFFILEMSKEKFRYLEFDSLFFVLPIELWKLFTTKVGLFDIWEKTLILIDNENILNDSFSSSNSSNVVFSLFCKIDQIFVSFLHCSNCLPKASIVVFLIVKIFQSVMDSRQ